MISVSPVRLLHLPIRRRALNLLTWDVWFSLTVIFWLKRLKETTCFCFVFCFLWVCKNSYIFWLFPYLFGTVPQSYLRGCIPGLSPQYVHQIKHNSQFLVCAFFSVNRLHLLCYLHTPCLSNFLLKVSFKLCLPLSIKEKPFCVWFSGTCRFLSSKVSPYCISLFE